MTARTRASLGAKQDTPAKQTPKTSANTSKKRKAAEGDTPTAKKTKTSKEKQSSATKRKVKQEEASSDDDVKDEYEDDTDIKSEQDDSKDAALLQNIQKDLDKKFSKSKENGTTPADIPMKDASSLLKDRKLKAYTATNGQSPFPDFNHPTPAEAKLAHKILSSIHGKKTRPKQVVASKDSAGCGDSPSVLDALVRTILSQNTSDKNSTRAKKSMDKTYGGSDNWQAIVDGGRAKLQESIKCGGLSQTKSKVIISILEQAKEKYGEYTLDHLFQASNEDAMTEMISFQGVGPKTASCVLLFCLQRESFAVDTHVHRITGLLGWRPAKASREETHAHLDVRIPDEDKYGLHILLVQHGKVCAECKAGGRNAGKCELRRAFGKKGKSGDVGGMSGEGDEDDGVKEEVEEADVKEEDAEA